MTEQLQTESAALTALLREKGAALDGFADMAGVENLGYPRGVSVALPIPRDVLRPLTEGPTRAYYDAYHALNAQLDEIVRAGAEFLLSRGHRALAQTTGAVAVRAGKRSMVPHKTVAVRAGLGWIGKSCLLVTPEYGGAVRISSLLTDAPLPCAEPVTASRCGSCTLCAASCPAGALTGTLWQPGIEREALFSYAPCEKTQHKLMRERTGLDSDLCGRCFAVCPHTRRYLGS